MDSFDQVGELTDNVVKQADAQRTHFDEVEWSGKQITKPGIYNGVPIEKYHHDTSLFDRWSISSSGLKVLCKRPSEYWAYSPYNEHRFERKSADHFKFGKAAHMLLLGETGFAEHYVKRPEKAPDGRGWNGNNLTCKEWLAEQDKAGLTVITQDELDRIQFMAESLDRNKYIQSGILNGRIERTMIAHVGSVALRARPDVIPMHGGDFTDPKTAAAVDHDSLMKVIFNSGLHIQAALVRMVAKEVMPAGFTFGEFTFVFIEKEPPFDVSVKVLKPTDIDLGERQVLAGLKTLERCISENRWPGVDGWDETPTFIEMPGWARTRIDTELNLETQQ